MTATIVVADRDSHFDGGFPATHNFTVTAPADGHLLIGFVWYGGDAAEITVGSLTIDGGAAVQHLLFHPGSQRHACLIAGKDVAAGDISVTLVLSAGRDWIICEAELATGINTAPIDTATSSNASFPSTTDVTHSLDLDTATGGVVFAVGGASVVGTPTGLDYAGLTDFGAFAAVGSFGKGLGGYQQIASGETPRSVSLVWDNDASAAEIYSAVAAAVSFAPAAAPAAGRSWGAVMG